MELSASDLLAKVRSPMLFGGKISSPIRVNTRDTRGLFMLLRKQEKVELLLDGDYLLEALEVAGALRESSKAVRVHGIDSSPEGPPGSPMMLNMTLGVNEDPRLLTWFIHTDLGVNYDRARTVWDARSKFIGLMTESRCYLVFERIEGDWAVARFKGRPTGNFGVRPNMWLTGASIVELKWDGDKALALLKDILTRPLGATYVALSEEQLSKLLKITGWSLR